jgi:hypothetical protein
MPAASGAAGWGRVGVGGHSGKDTLHSLLEAAVEGRLEMGRRYE